MAAEESFLVCYADNLTDINFDRLIQFHRSHDGLVTMALFRTESPKECGVAELGETGLITSFEEKPAFPKSSLANAGIYVMRPGIQDLLPHTQPSDIGFHLLPHCLGEMYGWLWEGLLMDIGNPQAYAQAQELSGWVTRPLGSIRGWWQLSRPCKYVGFPRMNVPRELGLVSAIVFSVTAAVGVWAAYDRSAAQQKLFLILLGLILALGLAWLSNNRLETIYTTIGLTSCLTVAGLGLSFLSLRSASGPIANGIVILLPLAMGAALWTLWKRWWLLVLLAGGSLVMGAVGLVLTGERTPWPVLGVGLLGAGVMHCWFVRKQSRPLRWLFDGVLALGRMCPRLCCHPCHVQQPQPSDKYAVGPAGWPPAALG